ASRSLAITEVSQRLIVGVEDGDAAGQVGNVEMILVLIKAAGHAPDIEETALILQFEIEDLHSAVVTVGNVNFRFAAFEVFDPDTVAGVELSVLLAAAADRPDVFEVTVKPADPLAAVTIDDIDVAVRSHRHIGLVGPIEFLGGAAGFGHVSDFVKNLPAQVRLINPRSIGRSFLVGADVLGPITKLLLA